MRDAHYKSLCYFQPQYDLVVDLIKRENKFCNRLAEDEREEFASNAVNLCIQGVIFGDSGSHCSTGGCIAVRVNNTPDMPGYKKVIVAYSP